MVAVSSLLTKINGVEEAPPDAYILYDLNCGIYWISVKDFVNFTVEWIGMSNPPPLTVDLASTCMHSIILDIDALTPTLEIEENILAVLQTLLKMTFLPALKNFTYIVALRRRRKGIHIHLPEIRIGHDDYVILCANLQAKLRQALRCNDAYKIDTLMNAMLPGAAKPDAFPYEPCKLVYVDEKNTFELRVSNFTREQEAFRKKFSVRPNNARSVFRSLLNCSARLLDGELKQLMMPVVCSDAPSHVVAYATSIGKTPNVSSDWEDVANFVYKKTREPGFACKCKRLVFDSGSVPLKLYHYLKLNASNMMGFDTNNHAAKMWYLRFGRLSAIDDSHIPEHFRDVHEMLQFEHKNLEKNPNPIKTVMQYCDGYYFLPVFYALCAHYRKDSRWMAEQLYALLDCEFHPLLDKMRAVDPKIIRYAVTDITANTIHFCANNLSKEQPKRNRDKLESIVENNGRAILSVTGPREMQELMRCLQERHLPIRVLRLKNALKKASRFIWNALTESWQEVSSPSEIPDHMNNLWNYVREFYKEQHRLQRHHHHHPQQDGGGGSGGGGGSASSGPEDEVIKTFSVSNLVSYINSDTVMERKDIQMDTHKWLLRLQDGVLDLLTGHIGGVVPEFYLSDRKIDLGVPRDRMRELCTRHVALYEILADRRFFLRYLKALFLDEAGTLLDALRHVLSERGYRDGDDDDDETARSMMHFYVNLCKCTSFDYDLLLYMLDVLASTLVATNYERKFFVWKGLTRNGKSKLFELMGRVLGGYYHSIQADNLAPGHSAGNATPELASTLFSCRMVTTEELDKRLDENRVKQITGNSFVAFRNMYEQNSGGIPTAKLFATTNHYPECKASEAFKDRVVAVPFDAEFVDGAPTSTSEQVEANVYPKEAYVVDQSYRGCFFLLYHHLRKHANPEDGLLHYRDEPECVAEFTRDYLIHADIYVQFKLHMDVQLKPGATTTLNDVQSAVRQYLKSTRNTSFHETDLFLCFEKEFADLRRTDVSFGSGGGGGYTSILDEQQPSQQQQQQQQQPPNKKSRFDQDLVYYDGVVIKNLKRQNFDDY